MNKKISTKAAYRMASKIKYPVVTEFGAPDTTEKFSVVINNPAEMVNLWRIMSKCK